MKPYFILMIVTLFLTLVACEKAEEKIDRIVDAFDLEPYDKIRATSGDVRGEIKDFVSEIQEEMEDAIE